jgi:hypothetical protein
MLAQVLAFLGSVFNLCIDTIYKIGVVMFGVFLSVILIVTLLTVALVWLLV